MPPKGAKKDKDKAAGAPKDLTGKHGEKTPAQLQADEDAKSLRRQARALGVISARSAGDNRDHVQVSRLKVAPGIKKHSGVKPVEILKRSTARKHKHLFVFPGLVSVVEEGKLGQLYDMDTNPKLDVDFPTGTLRMLGAFVYPKTKIMTLVPQRGGKKMQAQDFFEQMVVFSQHEWIGPSDADPTKDIPEAAYKPLHKDFDFAGGAAATTGAGAGGKGGATPSIRDFMVVDKEADAMVLDKEADKETGGRAKRAAAQKRVRYNGDSDNSDMSEASEEEDDAGGAAMGTRSPVRLPVDAEGLSAYFATCPQRKKAKAAQPSESRKTHKDLGDASDAEVISSDDSDKTSPPPPARKPSSQRTSAQKVKTYMLDSEEEEEEEEEDEEKGSRAKKPAPRKTPAKTSAQKKQKPKKGSESEDESESDESDESDGDDDSDDDWGG